MTRLHLALIRLALLIVVLLAWEGLPKFGIVNPMLLPPFSDVIMTLWELIGRPQVQEAMAVTALEGIVAFVIAVPRGAAIGIAAAKNEYFGEILKPMLFYVFSV